MDCQKTLVLIHGWGVSSEIFKSLYPFLEKDFQIYALDLPGFGQTPIEKPMKLKDYADFVYKYLKDKKIEQPIIIGHSFGGAVAVKLALIYPESISKIILAGAAAIRQPSVKTKIKRKIAGLVSPILSLKLKKMLIKKSGLEQSDYAAIQNPILKETFKTIINEDLTAELPLVKIPTLIVWGDKDFETPLDGGKLIAKLIPGSRIEIIKNASHFAFLEKPEEFIKLIKEFAL